MGGLSTTQGTYVPTYLSILQKKRECRPRQGPHSREPICIVLVLRLTEGSFFPIECFRFLVVHLVVNIVILHLFFVSGGHKSRQF